MLCNHQYCEYECVYVWLCCNWHTAKSSVTSVFCHSSIFARLISYFSVLIQIAGWLSPIKCTHNCVQNTCTHRGREIGKQNVQIAAHQATGQNKANEKQNQQQNVFAPIRILHSFASSSAHTPTTLVAHWLFMQNVYTPMHRWLSRTVWFMYTHISLEYKKRNKHYWLWLSWMIVRWGSSGGSWM